MSQNDSEYYFNALREVFEQHNISEVEVRYEGSGDSGSFSAEQATLMDGTVCSIEGAEGEEELPDDAPSLDIELKNQGYLNESWDDATGGWKKTSATRDIRFNDFVLEAAEHFVDMHHGGWENNEGGYGKVMFKRERNGIAAIAESSKQRITVINFHAEYIQHVEEYTHEYVSDKPEE